MAHRCVMTLLVNGIVKRCRKPARGDSAFCERHQPAGVHEEETVPAVDEYMRDGYPDEDVNEDSEES